MALARLPFGFLLIIHRSTPAQTSEIRGSAKRAEQSMPTQASGMHHDRVKPIGVRKGLFRIAIEALEARCRMVADRFNRNFAPAGIPAAIASVL